MSKDPLDRTQLESVEYRTRLLTKLNCLIAVIEVAIAKVSRSLESPGAQEERLGRIRGNLENTLGICQRAKATLQKVDGRARVTQPRASLDPSRMSYRDYVELSSIDEYRKFKSLPPIRAEEIADVDLDEILRRLAQ
jgi:hypothetical protein